MRFFDPDIFLFFLSLLRRELERDEKMTFLIEIPRDRRALV